MNAKMTAFNSYRNIVLYNKLMLDSVSIPDSGIWVLSTIFDHGDKGPNKEMAIMAFPQGRGSESVNIYGPNLNSPKDTLNKNVIKDLLKSCGIWPVVFSGPFASLEIANKFIQNNGNQAAKELAAMKKLRNGGLGDNAEYQQDIEKAKEIADSPLYTAWRIASAISCAAGAYHGYKRNESVGWALCWGFLGGLFPVITPAIAVAQGFGEKRKDLK